MINRIFIALILLGGALGYAWWSKKSLESQLAPAGESLLASMPAALFTTLEGDTFDLNQLKGSGTKAILIHFWATWCGPCETELPDLLNFINEQNADAVFLIVAINDEVPKIKKFMNALPKTEEKKVYWLLDNTQVHRQAFGTSKLPESYLFNGNGQMLRKLIGPQEWLKPLFFDMFKPFNP